MTYFDYEFICLFGRQIPSKASMEAVRASMDKESFSLFLENNANWVARCSKAISDKESLYRSGLADIDICSNAGLTESEIKRYIQYSVIECWHYVLRSNFTGGDPQKHKRRASAMVKALKNTDKRLMEQEIRKIDVKPILPNENLIRYKDNDLNSYLLATEYIVAFSYVATWDNQMFIVEMNPGLSLAELVEKSSQVSKECKAEYLFLEDMGRKQTGSPYFFHCPFCRNYSKVPRRKTPKSCAQCGKEYQQNWDTINRPPKPTRASAGWKVAFDGNRRDCQKCGEKRQVNEEYTCFMCYCCQNNINPKTFTK
jgi:hypothetical protein